VAFEIEEATIDGIHAAMREGEISCRELVGAYLQRVAAYDRAGPELNAIVAVNPLASSRAEELDAELSRTGKLTGPLHGIPVLVKDCIETRGMPTTFGSVAVGSYQPARDATVVRRLEAAGAVILAKTTLADFAASWFSYSSVSGETRNPYAPERDSGGSSAGSAAGVAANLGCVGIGSDCGGSIRLPSSFNSLVGMRSTTGMVSRAGSSMLIASQDTIGPLARTVMDAATVMDVLVGHDPEDPYTAAAAIGSPRPLYRDAAAIGTLEDVRIGVVREACEPTRDRESACAMEVVEGALASMRAAGAILADVSIPRLADQLEATSLYRDRMRHDIDAFLAARPEIPVRSLREIHSRGLYDRRLDLIGFALEGAEDPHADPSALRRHFDQGRFTRTLVNLLATERLDALVYPSVRVLPPRRDSGAPATLTYPTNTVIASQAGMPAIAVPAGFTPDGLPVGIEFVAKPYAEATLFRLAAGFERATRARRPPFSAPRIAAPAA
jgi:amidase